MTTTTDRSAVPAARERQPGPISDLTTVGFAWLLVLGMFLDAYAHVFIGVDEEALVTPWHLAIYAGFALASAWVAIVVGRYGGGTVATAPPGYGGAVAGLAIFGAGAVSDFAWHAAFGVEAELEALLSPPHVLLFVGALLIMTGPFRAAWQREDGARSLWPAMIALTGATSLTALFLGYSSAYAYPFPTADATGSLTQGIGVVPILVTNMILVAPLLLLLRRWQPPMGAATLLFGVTGALSTSFAAFGTSELVLGTLAGGLAADITIRATRAGPRRPLAVRVVATVTPLVLWTSHMVILQVTSGLTWPAELVSGVVLWAVLGGLALSLLTTSAAPVRNA